MEKKWQRLFKLSNHIIPENTYRKIKDIKDPQETISAMQYALICQLEQSHHILKIEIEKKEKQGEKMFYARNKLDMLGPKIRLLRHEFSEKDMEKAINIRHEIWREITNGAI